MKSDHIKQLINMAGVRLVLRDGIRTVIDGPRDLQGAKLYCGKKLLGTYEAVTNGVRFVYPRGSEYKHTTRMGASLTMEYVQAEMLRIALAEIREQVDRVVAEYRI